MSFRNIDNLSSSSLMQPRRERSSTPTTPRNGTGRELSDDELFNDISPAPPVRRTQSDTDRLTNTLKSISKSFKERPRGVSASPSMKRRSLKEKDKQKEKEMKLTKVPYSSISKRPRGGMPSMAEEEDKIRSKEDWELRRIKYLKWDKNLKDVKQICEKAVEFSNPYRMNIGKAPSLSHLCTKRIRYDALAGNITHKTLPNEMKLCDAYLFQILSWPGLTARILSRLEYEDKRLHTIESLWAYFISKHLQIDSLPKQYNSWREVYEERERSLRKSVAKMHQLKKNMCVSSSSKHRFDTDKNLNSNKTIKIERRIRHHKESTRPTGNTSLPYSNRQESIIERLRSKRRRQR